MKKIPSGSRVLLGDDEFPEEEAEVLGHHPESGTIIVRVDEPEDDQDDRLREVDQDSVIKIIKLGDGALDAHAEGRPHPSDLTRNYVYLWGFEKDGGPWAIVFHGELQAEKPATREEAERKLQALMEDKK